MSYLYNDGIPSLSKNVENETDEFDEDGDEPPYKDEEEDEFSEDAELEEE